MAHLQVRELTPAFGTEIVGLDPERALSDADLGLQLQSLFDRTGVLVFRDLDIDQAQQANLIRLLIGLGPLEPGEPASGRPGGAEFYVSNKEQGGGAPFGRLLFHSDMMWSEHTFRVLSLYGVEIEQPASPTIFASARHGWTTLPDNLRERVAEMSVVQGHDEEDRARAANDPNILISTFTDLPTRSTPVALTHPRTGETVLYVSEQMTQGIETLERDESEALLAELFTHLYRTALLYEHAWQTHDLVAWDNIAVQHARPNVTLDGPVRTLRKVFAPVPPRTASPSRPTFSSAR
jgi:alpha-ketoglutarate-dependent taurine dioxygenase